MPGKTVVRITVVAMALALLTVSGCGKEDAAPPALETKKAERLMAKVAHLRELTAILDDAQKKRLAETLARRADQMERESRPPATP